jgi:Spy/CpxP family protein refolding chaperone
MDLRGLPMSVFARPTLALALCLVAGMAMPSHAVRQPPKDRQHQMADALKLTPEQKTKFEALHKTDRPKMEAMQKAVKDQQQVVEKLFADAQASDADVEAAFKKLHGLRAEMMAFRAKHMLAMRALLTPAQRQTFIERHPMGDEGMMNDHGPMGGRGGHR